MTYMITFSGYGTHLHGHELGSWKDGALQPPNTAREKIMRERMIQPPFVLDSPQRPMVLDALVTLAGKRGWTLLAAHVRTTHVHAVLVCEAPAQRALVACKASATQALNLADGQLERRRWSQGGNVLHLRSSSAVTAAIRYVLHRQGEPMSVYSN
ncbi:MAG: hypothetical protein K2X03_21310 [Bryobacteraceae bacterium]|nr:hypothetical protein [Bryobacteraceae bacterium]